MDLSIGWLSTPGIVSDHSFGMIDGRIRVAESACVYAVNIVPVGVSFDVAEMPGYSGVTAVDSYSRSVSDGA